MHLGRVIALAIVMLAVSGCGLVSIVRVSVNDSVTAEDVSFIEPGKTTLTDVVARLGMPDEMTGSENGALILYHFRDAKYSRVNYGWILRFWLALQPDFVFAGGGLGTDVFQVAFDDRWIAQHHAFSKHSQASRYKFWPF
jgi:hypothetical protein